MSQLMKEGSKGKQVHRKYFIMPVYLPSMNNIQGIFELIGYSRNCHPNRRRPP